MVLNNLLTPLVLALDLVLALLLMLALLLVGVPQLLENVLTPCTDSLVLNICAAQFNLGEVTAGTHGLPRKQQIVGPSVIQQARGLMNTTTDDE